MAETIILNALLYGQLILVDGEMSLSFWKEEGAERQAH